MVRSVRAGLLGFLLLILGGTLVPLTALAAEPTVIRVDAPAEAGFTKRILVDVHLETSTGKAIPDRVVSLAVDGTPTARTRTGADGGAKFSISEDIPPGTHELVVAFDGDETYAAARETTSVEVIRAFIRVTTLPVVAGAEWKFEGQTFTTDAAGVGIVYLDAPPDREDRPTLVSVPAASGSRTEFARWWGNAPELTASFDIYYDVALRFTDRLGEPVPNEEIESATLRSSIGEVIKLDTIEPIEVYGVRVVSLAGGLEVKDIVYGVDDVTIEGTNVVNRAQQRFVPRETADWNVTVLFYETSVKLTDALFGFPVRASVLLTYPGGRVDTVMTGDDGVVTFEPLPRGNYTLTPQRVGMTVVRPLAVSRDADAELAVITYLDIAVVVLAAGSIAVLLLLVGRPGILRTLRRWFRTGGRYAVRRWGARLRGPS